MQSNLSDKVTPYALAGLLAASLCACGGGGGGGTAAAVAPTPSNFPVQQALTHAFTHGLQSTLNITGSSSNGGTTYPLSGSLTYTLSAAINTTFEGAPAFQSIETINGTVSANGMSTPLAASIPVYVNAQYAPIGSNETGNYCVASTPSSYPASASAGQTGEVATMKCYTDGSKRTLSSTEKITYVTTAGADANSLNFQTLRSVYDLSNKLVSSGTTTYSISSAGIPKLTRVQISQTHNGISANVDAK